MSESKTSSTFSPPLHQTIKDDLDYIVYKVIEGDPNYTPMSIWKCRTKQEKEYMIEKLSERQDNITCKSIIIELIYGKEYLKPALELEHTMNSHVLTLIGTYYHNHNESTKALEYTIKASNMGNCNAISNLGCMYWDSADIEKAIELFRYRVDAGHHRPLVLLGILLREKDKKESISLLTRAYHTQDMFTTSYDIFNELCTLTETDQKDKEKYRAILENGRLQHNLYIKTQKEIYKISSRIKRLEEEIYAPENLGAKAVKLSFKEKAGSLEEE